MCNIFKNVCWAYLWMWFRCTCIVLDFECTFILQNYRSKEEQEKIDVFLGTKRHPCYWAPCSYSSHHSQEAHGIIILQNKTENTCLSYEGINLWFLSIRIINSICWILCLCESWWVLLSWFCWWLHNKLFRQEGYNEILKVFSNLIFKVVSLGTLGPMQG